MVASPLTYEFIIIGGEVLIWMWLGVSMFFCPNWIPYAELKAWTPLLSVAVLGVAYTMGVISDRFFGLIHLLLGKFEVVRNIRERLLGLIYKLDLGSSNASSEAHKKPSLEEIGTIMIKSPEVYKFLVQSNRLFCLLRGTFFNALPMAFFGIPYIYRICDLSWLVTIMVVVIWVLICSLIFYAWGSYVLGYQKGVEHFYKQLSETQPNTTLDTNRTGKD